jgi:membrane-associated phospholipid phosphatase
MTNKNSRFRLGAERLESRDVPSLTAVGSAPGTVTTASLVDLSTGLTRFMVIPFDGFTGGANVACADVTGDGVTDLIAAAGQKGGPRVVVRDGTNGSEVQSFFAYDLGFRGGMTVAAGDVNDDGIAEVITGALAGGGPHVKVFDGRTGEEWLSFFAFDPLFQGGLSVAVGDVNGDGRGDVIVGAGAGGAPHVKVFSGVDGKELLSLFAYDRSFSGGVNVSSGDFNRDGLSDILTGPGTGGGSHVRCFGGDGTLIDEVMLGDPASRTGVMVGCAPGGPNGDLLLAATPNNTIISIYDGVGGPLFSTLSVLPGSNGVNLSNIDPTLTDPVLVWNDVALRAIRSERVPPPRASCILAMMHAAMFDAVNAIARKYQSYLPQAAPPNGASQEAAAIAAAHKTLSALFPNLTTKFDALRAAQLAVLPVLGREPGGQVGEAAAAAILSNRANDIPAPPSYTPGTLPGEWRPTLPANVDFLLPEWGQVRPFAMTSGDQFRPTPPPALTSDEYATAFEEVKVYGSRTSSVRTADQTEIALFWAAGGGTDTPPGMNNRIAENVVSRKKLSLVDTARVFALLNLAEADAAITAWGTKLRDNLWRPITAIREAATDGHPATNEDATWTPLLATPPFPAYTSGHSTFSAAGAAVLNNLFGDMPFTTWSSDLPGVARSFTSFAQAAVEAGQSRIYGGIHFQFDNTAGLSSGQALGSYVVANFLKPV